MRSICAVSFVAALALFAGCRQTGSGGGSTGGGGALPVFSPGTTQVVIGSLPTSRASFDALWTRTAVSPEGAIACFIAAAMVLETDPALGEECMIRAAVPDGRPGASFRELIRRFRDQPWLARSYVQGATPENGYAARAPYRIVFDLGAGSPLGRPGGNLAKRFVISSGADSPRPVTVAKEGRGYRIHEASSISVGVRKPR